MGGCNFPVNLPASVKYLKVAFSSYYGIIHYAAGTNTVAIHRVISKYTTSYHVFLEPRLLLFLLLYIVNWILWLGFLAFFKLFISHVIYFAFLNELKNPVGWYHLKGIILAAYAQNLPIFVLYACHNWFTPDIILFSNCLLHCQVPPQPLPSLPHAVRGYSWQAGLMTVSWFDI